MELTPENLTPEEIEAIENPQESSQVSKKEYLRQIETDYLVAKKRQNEAETDEEKDAIQGELDELSDKHKRVKTAPDSKKAKDAYHVRPVISPRVEEEK